jgi:glycosyl transferase family 25
MNPRPPVWVISLTRAVERRRLISRSLEQLSVDFEVFDAVDGRALNASELRQYSQRGAMFRLGRAMMSGEVGCALSHLALYSAMVERDLPVVAVMEDDAEPSPNLPDVLDALRDLPFEWDVITLHSLFHTSDPIPVSDGALVGDSRVCAYRGPIFGTQCYLITRAAAAKLARVGAPVRIPADTLLYGRRPAGLTVYGVEPSPVGPGRFPTEIGDASSVVDESRGPADSLVVLAGKVWRAGSRFLS